MKSLQPLLNDGYKLHSVLVGAKKWNKRDTVTILEKPFTPNNSRYAVITVNNKTKEETVELIPNRTLENFRKPSPVKYYFGKDFKNYYSTD